MSYTVQYFERAVFEKHPENAPPHDVLLSHLGTFQYGRIYLDSQNGCIECPNEVTFQYESPGTMFRWNDTFSEAGTTMTLDVLRFADGTSAGAGYGTIDDRQFSGGDGQDLRISDSTVDFRFAQTPNKVTLVFGEVATDESYAHANVTVNGAFAHVTDLTKLNGTLVGGVAITASIYGPPAYESRALGTMTLIGAIHQFSIGGLDVWIDKVRPYFTQASVGSGYFGAELLRPAADTK